MLIVDSPGGRSWRSGEVVDTIGGPIIPMSERMTFMDLPEDDFPEGRYIDEVNKIGGPYTSKSLETQKVLNGGEDNTVEVPTLVLTHSFLHGMSNIISTPTTVGSSTARSVTVVEDKKKQSSGGGGSKTARSVTVVEDKKKKSSGGGGCKCKCGCGGRVQGKDMYTKSCAQRLGVPYDPHGVIKKQTERRRIKRGLMAEERLAAAGLSVNEYELGDDVIQAIVLVITGKKVTAFPEVYESLLHHMPTLFESYLWANLASTPTLPFLLDVRGMR